MAVLFGNNATSTLAASINTAVTSISVAAGDAGKFPTPGAGDWFPLTVVDSGGNMEVVRCTARAGATLTVARAQEGTTAKAFAAGSRVELRITAAAIADIPSAKVNRAGDTMTGTLAATELHALGSNILIKGDSNKHLWFTSLAGVQRGLLYHDASGDPGITTNLYSAAGTFNQALSIKESGWQDWTGAVTVRGSKLGYGNTEDRSYVDSNTFFRWIYVSDNTAYLQRATNSAFTDAVNYLRFTAGGECVFMNGIYAPFLDTSSDGMGTNVKIGNDAWLGDINQADTISVRGQSNWNNGWLKFGAGPNKLGVNGAVADRLYWGGSFFMQSDGNMYLPMLGNYLGNVLFGTGQWWQNVGGSRAINTVYQNTTGRGIVVSIQASNLGNSLFQVSTDGANWLSIGYPTYDATSGGASTNLVSQGPFIVPHGSYYRLTGGAGFNSWLEMRN